MLALYDQERDPLADISTAWACRSWWDANRRLTRAASAARRSWAPMPAGEHGRPRVGAAQNAEDRAERQGPAQLEPGIELFPRPAVHPALSPATSLASTDEHGAALAVKIGLNQVVVNSIVSPATLD